MRAEFRYADAIGVLNQLIERDPQHGPARLLRGRLHDENQNAEAAYDDLRSAVNLLPADVDARLVWAGFLGRTGRTREAIAHFEWVLTNRPTDPEALLGLAKALMDNADSAGAVARLDELLTHHPEHADGLTERGRLALRANRPAEAAAYLARATAAAPWHREAARLLHTARLESNPSADAVKAAARITELTAEDATEGRWKLRAKDDPKDVAVRWDLWQWSVRNGQEDEGLAYLFEILQTAPNHPLAHEALATYFDRAGQPQRAAAHRGRR
jgi:Tfp pilus assembly protein PilF